MTNEHNTRAKTLGISFLRNGLATPSEVAHLARVSRQLVNYWIDAEKIDPHKARRARLTKEWRRRIRKA